MGHFLTAIPFSKDFVYYLFVVNSILNSTQSYNYDFDSTQDKVKNYGYSLILTHIGLKDFMELHFFCHKYTTFSLKGVMFL